MTTLTFSSPSAHATLPLDDSPFAASRFPSGHRCLSRRIYSLPTMASCHAAVPPTVRTVSISFAELKDKQADLSAKIEEGFGPNGLGILSVSDMLGKPKALTNFLYQMWQYATGNGFGFYAFKLHNEPDLIFHKWAALVGGRAMKWFYDREWTVCVVIHTVLVTFVAHLFSSVPGYSSLRQNLLNLAPRLASLPDAVKRELEDPHSRYNFGWSHGKEKLESGKPDMLKGSFYANPILDVPTDDASVIQRYPSYCGQNIWPHNALPELEVAFKALGKMIMDVGLLLAYHCDRYVSREIDMHADEGLEQILLRSRCNKGRLLYYFPAESSYNTQDAESMSSWCGWHTDHGSLTGLTCAMFTKGGVAVPCPDSNAGLYIKTRMGQVVKVVYSADEIAYQIGETTEILSRGHLCATPHCVRAPNGEETSGLERSTFALFMQPDWDERLNFPEVVNIHQELISSNGSLTFGEYTEKLLDKYYHLKM